VCAEIHPFSSRVGKSGFIGCVRVNVVGTLFDGVFYGGFMYHNHKSVM